MEKFIKAIFVIVPTLLLIIGVFFIVKAAQFWLVIISPSNMVGYPLSWEAESPIEATVYLPTAIRPKDSPIKIDVDINRKTGEEPLSVMVQMTGCDYVSFDKSYGEVKFDTQLPGKQTFPGKMIVRNMTPPTNCEIIIQTSTLGGLGYVSKTIPVDAATGNAVSVIQLLLGLAGTFLGFTGLKGLVSQR